MPLPNDLFNIQARLNDLESRSQAMETVLGDQADAIDSVTLTTVSGSGADVVINNNLIALRTAVNEIIAALESHGLIASG